MRLSTVYSIQYNNSTKKKKLFQKHNFWSPKSRIYSFAQFGAQAKEACALTAHPRPEGDPVPPRPRHPLGEREGVEQDAEPAVAVKVEVGAPVSLGADDLAGVGVAHAAGGGDLLAAQHQAAAGALTEAL